MVECPYYQVAQRNIESRKIRVDRQRDVQTVHIPWCSHKHSPAPQSLIDTVGSARILQCQGELSKCQVPPDKFDDTA